MRHRQVQVEMLLLAAIVLVLQTGPGAAVPSELPGRDRVEETETPPVRTFSTGFLSLSPRHTIATSLFIFGGGNNFAIRIPGVECLEPSGSCRQSGFFFKADFTATVLKHNKHYRYTFSAKGLSLFDSYIGGFMVLDEQIQETGQQQRVTFLFWGASETSGADERKTIFPF